MDILHPEYRDELSTTRYPFADSTSLTNVQGDFFLEGTFLDAAFYPVGGQPRMYLSQVQLTYQQCTLTLGDSATANRATGVFNLLSPPSIVRFLDTYNRPAGLLVSTPSLLGIFQSWSVGTHTFKLGDTEFCARCCTPTPEPGVRGFLLEDGTLVTGDVWLVGEDGVVLRKHQIPVDSQQCGDPTEYLEVIRVDVVGDPLFRRRLCGAPGLFVSQQFIRSLTIKQGKHQFTCKPDAHGDFQISVGHNLAYDTVLRVRTTAEGLVVEVVGSKQGG